MADQGNGIGITRRRIVKAGAGGLALAASPFRVNILRAQEGPIKIGFPVPLSGPYSTEANDQVRCAQIACDFFNEAGGLKGRKAELLVRDDKLDPGEASTRTLELIENEKVNFVCGSLSASVQLSVNQVATKRGVIYNSISQSDTINEASDFTKYTFHEALNPHMTSGAVGRYAFGRSSARRSPISPPTTPTATRCCAASAASPRRWASRGGRHPPSARHRRLLDLLPAHPGGAARHPRRHQLRPRPAQHHQAGERLRREAQMKIVYPVLLDTQRLAGGAAPFEGIIGGTYYYWGIEESHPAAKRFNDAYRKKHGDAVPSSYGSLGFAGLTGLLAGVTKAGTVDADAVIAAMEAIKYDVGKGEQYFRKCDHQAVQSVLVIESKPEAKMKDKSDIFDVVQTTSRRREGPAHLPGARPQGVSEPGARG